MSITLRLLVALLLLSSTGVDAQRHRFLRPGPPTAPPAQGRDVACGNQLICSFVAEANTATENYNITGLSASTTYSVKPPKTCNVGDTGTTSIPGFPYGFPVDYTTNASGALTIPIDAAINCTVIIGENVVNINSGADLGAAITNAQAGDTLLLAQGATFTGAFTLRANKSGWVTIRGAGTGANVVANVVEGAFPTEATARYYYLENLNLTHTTSPAADLLRLGTSASSQDTLEKVPEFFVVDNVRLTGHATNGQRMGIAMHSGATKIINSTITRIFASSAQSIGVAMGNGPGPYLIADNTIEAAAINVFSGGIDPPIIGLVPSDIFVTRNTIRKDPVWETNGNITVWNLIEWKNAQRVSITYNTFENMWKAPSNAWGLSSWNKSVDQVVSGSYECTQCVVKDVYYGYNTWLKVSGGPQVTAIGEGNPIPMHNVVFEHNFWEIDTSLWTTQDQSAAGRFALSFNGAHNIEFKHNTVYINRASSVFIAPENNVNNGFVFTNNIWMDLDLGFKGPNQTEGTNTINTYFPSATLGGNLYQTNGGTYPAAMGSGVTSLVTNGGYNVSTRLLDATSAYKNTATDGTDPGWDGTGGRP